MNILIPHTWLLEHLETAATPLQIQEYLSLCGPSVERIYEREGDSVYDIEVTTNRVDSMSVRGIAREAAAILPRFGVAATLKELTLPTPVLTTQAVPLPKVTNDPQLNKRTTFVVLQNVQRSPTPEWMAKRLRQIDMNVHDAVIDITNYVTHELGHPCHAFDYDKLMATGGEIIITEADKGETFVTLDGEPFTTVGGEVVFKNARGEIIDLPSIKGTQNTSIDDTSSSVLLLLESIMAPKVRFASMTHAIRTTAAQLMEKNADPHLATDVINLGVKQYVELCGATVASGVFDEFAVISTPQPITVPIATITDYLGITIPADEIHSILSILGCTAHVHQVNGDASQATIEVTPPTFRPDLTIVADVIEEIARIYGYHNLPSVIMDTALPLIDQPGVNFSLEQTIKDFLAAIGWQEVYTYSMVSETLAQESGFALEDHVTIANPLTDDRIYLRRSLVPSLTEVFTVNPQRQILSVFELANVYHPQPNAIPDHELQLGLVSSKPFRKVKGDLEALAAKLFLPPLRVEPTTGVDEKLGGTTATQTGLLLAENHELGSISILRANRTAIVLKIARLLKLAKTHPTYRPLPKTTPIIEDMTFTLPPITAMGDLITAIKASDTLIATVTLKDSYHHNHTFTIWYLDPEKNLAVEDIVSARRRIAELVTNDFKGGLVGQLG